MTEEKTVRGGTHWLVWLFAVVGLCGLLAMIYVGVAVLRMAHNGREDPAPIEAKNPTERFAVADVDAIPGTGLAQIVIATEASVSARGGGYSSGGERTDERNLLLLDKATGGSRKLLPDNGRQVVAREMLPAVVGTAQSTGNWHVAPGPDGKEVTPPVAYYLLRVRAVDGKSEDVLLGNIASGRQDFVLRGIDGVDRIWMQAPTRVAMLMRQKRKLYYRVFEVPELKLVAARPIEID